MHKSLNLTHSHRRTAWLTGVLLFFSPVTAHQSKPTLTLDKFFSAVEIRSVQISPDGHAVVIETMRPDWAAQRFRNDLWLYRDSAGGTLVQLTHSGHDSSPQWSPNGHWIAFLSPRRSPAGARHAKAGELEKFPNQIYVISTGDKVAVPITNSHEEIHAFCWSSDSRSIYFATRAPRTTGGKDAPTEQWHDVIRFRAAERGDAVFTAEVDALVPQERGEGQRPAGPRSSKKLLAIAYRVAELATSPNGRFLAVATDSLSGRLQSHEPYRIYVDDIASGTLHQAIHTQEGVDAIRWAPDSEHIFFTYEAGTPEGPYREEVQTRLYWVSAAGGKAERWARRFPGEVGVRYTADPGGDFGVMHDGRVLVVGRLGTEVQPYRQSVTNADFAKQPAWAGTYEMFSLALHSSRVAFVYSSLERPREVYIAESTDRLQQAIPITAFNKLIAECDLPRGKIYRWNADDGTEIEGMLIYPPGKFGAKHLPTLTWLHGGPQMADGNEFRSPHAWAWFALAATRGWLIFDPNYRGSTGYGDRFAMGFVPHVNSRPAKDILQGVDALVKDGIADPEQLTVAGYSNGGFLTNWLITQTSRFKAAVTGAGIVENVVMWGNSEAPIYFAHSLGGVPWQAETNYNTEAAIWQIANAKTPTLIITGSEDSNVPPLEAYVLERALYTTGIPHRLLIFPGEGHSFDNNPRHLKIAVREELRWIERYGRKHRGSG